MKIITEISAMQDYSRTARAAAKVIGVVPTMGYLHEGHLSLIDIAGKNADVVVVTIFVNPTQFGPNEDLARYPRDFERDRRLCELRGAEVIFAPTPEEMYPEASTVWVTEEKLSAGLCGSSRPTHFRGVTTVVAKLFNAVLPDVAVFGWKDAQQALIIKKMVQALNFPVKILLGPIVRESDGLAMSSRNKYLSAPERRQALVLFQSLQSAGDAISARTLTEAGAVAEAIKTRITQAGGRVDYVAVVDADDLEPKPGLDGRILIAVAAYFGKTRLIDNIVIG